MLRREVLVALAACGPVVVAIGSHPWGSEVVRYVMGEGVSEGYDDPLAALGEPTRYTGRIFGFPGAVTPFNPAFDPGELVTVGRGGELVVRFARAVWDDPSNPFGIDLLIFGNAGFIDADYPNGVAGPLFGAEPGLIEVSQDGEDWQPIPGVGADGMFPTLGYLDLAGPYREAPGAVFSNFQRPVDPTFNPIGRTFAEIVAAYDGSGGGAGVDIGVTGLAWIQYVRVTNGMNAGGGLQIDGFAAVPSPGAVLILAGAAVMRRRRGR